MAENDAKFVTGKLSTRTVAFGKYESSVHDNEENSVSGLYILQSKHYVFAEKRECSFCPNAIRTQIFMYSRTKSQCED